MAAAVSWRASVYSVIFRKKLMLLLIFMLIFVFVTIYRVKYQGKTGSGGALLPEPSHQPSRQPTTLRPNEDIIKVKYQGKTGSGGALLPEPSHQPSHQPSRQPTTLRPNEDIIKLGANPDINAVMKYGNNSHPLSLHCGTCALVSNAGILLNTSAGEEIDSKDCVFRMNLGPTTGFEDDVGRRTTVRHVSFLETTMLKKTLYKLLKEEENIYLISRGEVKTKRAAEAHNEINKSHNSTQLYLLNATIDEEIVRNFKDRCGYLSYPCVAPSTGYRVLMLSLLFCENVTLYGMMDAFYCMQHPRDQTRVHYYNQKRGACEWYNKWMGNRKHPQMLLEKVVMRTLLKDYPISFRYPEWV